MQTMKGKEKETPRPQHPRGTASAHLSGDLFAQTVLWTASGPWSQGQGLMMDALVSLPQSQSVSNSPNGSTSIGWGGRNQE